MQVLQTFWLRAMAGKMAYYDKERFATDDAVRIGRLHTLMPGSTLLTSGQEFIQVCNDVTTDGLRSSGGCRMAGRDNSLHTQRGLCC